MLLAAALSKAQSDIAFMMEHAQMITSGEGIAITLSSWDMCACLASLADAIQLMLP